MIRLAAILALVAALGGCTSLPPTGTFTGPSGFATYGTTADGKRVRVWTDYRTGTTTGTVGGQSIRLRSY